MDLQKNFVNSVHLYFKDEGRAWLSKLPDLIRFCEEKWLLTMKEPFPLSINYVAPAITNEGKEVVVKICIPSEGFKHELEALKLYGNKSIATLIDWDNEHGILILEKVSPGYTLEDIPNNEEACRYAANVMRNLAIPAPAHTILPTTKGREENLREIVKQHPEGYGPFTNEMLEKALKMFTYLNETIEQYWLLHGDFHHYNLLSKGNNFWVAIDPKGLIGEIEYDLIQYMLNNLPEHGAYDVIQTRVNVFTDQLKLDQERLILWGYCHTVLATCWTVDDNGSYDNNFYQGVEIFNELYKDTFGKSIITKIKKRAF